MNSQSLPDTAIDLGTPSSTQAASSAKPNRWWRNPFQRSDSPRRPWLRRSRALEELRAEHSKLIETIEQLNERIEKREEAASKALNPMPVIRGIENISAGQKDITAGQKELSQRLQSLNGFMEKASATDAQLTKAVAQVDDTLAAVQGGQVETVGALGKVSDRMDNVTLRFETLFERMAEAERAIAAEYKKLQQRTLISLAAITAAVVGA
ncbi:MAG: hypothetical protein ACQKBU_12155, partial [Verrucomicrobiales bacterium]